MDPAIKRGFLIGFLIVAGVLGVFAWRDGWIAPGQKQAAVSPPPVVDLVPRAPERPKPAPGVAEVPPLAKPAAPGGGGATPPSSKGAEASPPASPGAISEAARRDGTPGVTPGAKPPGQAASPDKGAFDIVRVEPSGDLVVAGRCPANCTAELTANGTVQDKATADAGGNFAMTPPALPPGDHQLGLKITTADGKQQTSEQSVTVSVPAAPSKEVVVVLNDPDAPSKILQRPGQTPATAAQAGDKALGDKASGDVAARGPTGDAGVPKPEAPAAKAPAAKTPAARVAALSLGAVDAENGRFFVQGSAPAGAKLRVYLNNALIAEPVAGSDERWSLRVERGLSPGSYVARVDQLDGSGRVVSRAEARFAYEAEVAAAAPNGAAPKPEAPSVAAKPPAAAGAAASAPAAAAKSTPAASASAAAAAAAKSALPSEPRPPDTGSGGGADNRSSQSPDPSAGSSAAGAPSVSSPDAGAASAAPPADAAASAGVTAPRDGVAGSSRPNAPATPSSAADGDRPDASPGAAQTADAAPALAASPESPPVVSAADPANPVIASIDTAKVRRGDSLWRISRATYGRGRRYTVIFTANDAQIRNPNLIYPGQVLVLPSDSSDASAR